MKKRLFSLMLCLAMLITVFTSLGVPAAAASDIPLGTYTNSDYSSSVTFKSDLTFSFVMNFGEGFETVTGTYYTWEMDDGETVVTLNVTSKHTGIVVYDTYNFSGIPQQDGQLYLTDGNAGIVPTETVFALEDVSGSSGLTDAQISASRAAIAVAVKSNNEKLAAAHKTAVASGHTYVGYRGAALDSWAVKEVGIADAMDLMPTEVNDYFYESITREDFAALVYSALLRLTGTTESQLKASVTLGSFPDSSDTKVGVCAGLGIITGYDTGKFLPEKTITRQEAAAMLSRLAETIGAKATGNVSSFNDISGLWGENSIRNVSTLKDGYTGKAVMGGTGANCFSPFDSYSRQQAVVTIVRMVGVSAGGTSSSSNDGSYEAVSAAVEAKVNALGADGTLSGDDIKAILDFVGTLEDQGLVMDLEAHDSYVLYTTADGTPSGIVIDQETESEDGEPTLGYGAAEPSAKVSLAAADDTLYLENNKVLFISTFSQGSLIYNQPLLKGVQALRDKGYDVTVQNDASLTQFAALGSGDYSMIIIVSHGTVLGDQFCLCTKVDESTAYAEDKYLIGNQVRAIDRIPVDNGGMFGFTRTYYITPSFFSNHLESDPLDNAYVQFISCNSMKNQSMADTFLSNGAKAVTGYTDLVLASYAGKALELTAENLLPAQDIPDGTETTIGDLESSVLKKLGLNAFWWTSPQTSERRAVLTRFDATGAENMVLAVRNAPEDFAKGLVITGGTYYYTTNSISGTKSYYATATYLNNSDMTITGIGVAFTLKDEAPKTQTDGQRIYKDINNPDFSLKPGESITSYWRFPNSSNGEYYAQYIVGYTTGSPRDNDSWVTIPVESYVPVRFTKVPAPSN
ncbi:MAG: S-layer homology domain-containing protein [Oscillospiraceae bacterium]|nr:S-layer homology domain-containing protein [Oscillospiraceae bacterium]